MCRDISDKIYRQLVTSCLLLSPLVDLIINKWKEELDPMHTKIYFKGDYLLKERGSNMHVVYLTFF